jgi:SRSO17 transposase
MQLTDDSILLGSVQDLYPISLSIVDKTELEPLWDDMVRQHHYLGFGKMIGQRIKYLAEANGRPIAALSYNRGALRVGVRDAYIGWNEECRKQYLDRIVCNHRFLILPWIRVKNLASHVLALSLRRLRQDWKRLYGYEPAMVETFVSSDLYRGTCYFAANFAYLGETKGFGKQGKTFEYHGNKKKVFLFQLDKKFIPSLPPEMKKTRPEEPEETDRWEEAKKDLSKPDFEIGALKPALRTESAKKKIAELAGGYLDAFKECFDHVAQYRHFIRYFMGLLSTLDSKSFPSIGGWFGDLYASVSFSNFTQTSPWSEEKMLDICRRKLSEEVAEDGAMITADTYSIHRKGGSAVGFAPQPLGPDGRESSSSQSSVMIGYSGRKGCGFIDRPLRMPEIWMSDAYAEKRSKCGVPDGLEAKTRGRLAAEAIGRLAAGGMFPADWIGMDRDLFGDIGFIKSIPKGMHYFAEIDGLDGLSVLENQIAGKGPGLPGGGGQEITAAAKEIIGADKGRWKTVESKPGIGKPVWWDEKTVPVRDSRPELSKTEARLYAARLSDGSHRYFVSDAPDCISKNKFKELFIRRLSAERSLTECAFRLGLDGYSGRSWAGFHRHTALVFVANLFLLMVRKNISE